MLHKYECYTYTILGIHELQVNYKFQSELTKAEFNTLLLITPSSIF